MATAVSPRLICYEQCEKNGTSYVIRLKENGILREKVSDLVDELDEITPNNTVDYAAAYLSVLFCLEFLVSRHWQEIEGSFLSVAEKQILTHMSLHQFGKGKVIKGFFCF